MKHASPGASDTCETDNKYKQVIYKCLYLLSVFIFNLFKLCLSYEKLGFLSEIIIAIEFFYCLPKDEMRTNV